MPIEVELPDGSVVEFPDGTDGTTMERALARHRSGAPTKPAAPPQRDGGEMSLSDLITGRKPQPWDYNPTGIKAADGVTRQVGATADALQHRLVDLPLGIAQLVGNTVNSGIQKVAGDTEWAQGVDARNTAQNAQVAQREADYQERTGTTAGSYLGSVVGQVLPWITGVGALRSAGALPKLDRLGDVAGVGAKARNIGAKTGLLAAEGAASGAAQPVGDGSPYWEQKGSDVALGGVAAPLMVAGGAAATKSLGAVADGARLLTASGRDALADRRLAGMLDYEPNILNTLRNAPQYVAGEQPTLAQVVATPKAVQVERSLRNNPQAGPAFAEQDALNNAARVEALQRIAGDDAAMEAAKAARSAGAASFRSAHLPDEGGALVDHTSIVPLLTRLTDGADPAVSKAAQRTLRLLNKHAKANGGKVPATVLDDIQQNVGETLRQMSANGPVTPKQVARFGPVKTQIVDALDGAVPGYRDYLAAYARDSAPINDMAAARRLMENSALAGRDGSGGQVLSIPQLRQTLRLDDKADFPMTDTARGEIENILQSLQRRSISDNKVAASGPGTAAEAGAALLDSPVARVLGGTGAGILGTTFGGPLAGIAAALTAEGAGAARRDITRRVGEKAATSTKAAAALEAGLRARQRALQGGVPKYLLPWDGR
jgi:hypothetical protein